MKKALVVLMALAVMVLVPLTGCGGGGDEGGSAPEDEVRATAETFMNAMQEGDFEAMKACSDPALYEEDGDLYAFGTIDKMDEIFAESLGIDISADDLGESTKAGLQDFVDKLMGNLVKSYEITDVSVKDSTGTVNITTTYGYDPDKMQDIDLDDEVETIAMKYMSENQDELTEIYQNDGETAMFNKVLDDLLPDILSKYMDQVLETGEVTQNSVMTLEKQDDGSWLVTGEKATE